MAKSQIVYTNPSTGYIPTNLIDPANLGSGSSTLAGDVTGTSATTVVSGIRGISVSATLPTLGQTLVFNGTNYAPATVSSGTITFATVLETETGTDTTKALNAAGTEATYIKKSTINAKGDLIVGTADNTFAVLPLGAPGEIIAVDTTTPTGLKYVPSPFGFNVIAPTPYVDFAAQLLAAPVQSVTQNSITKTVLIRDQAGDGINFTPNKYDIRSFKFSSGTGTIATHFADNNEDTEFVTLITGDVATVSKVTLNINATTGVNTASTITLRKKTGATIVDFATITVPANATITNGVAIAGTVITAASANILTDNDQLLVNISGGSLTALDFTINTLITIV